MKSEQSLQKLNPDATLAQILSVYQRAGGLLASIGLNISNHKDQSLRSICQQRQWSEDEVLQWLKRQEASQNESSAMEDQPQESDFGNDLTGRCSYVENRFHRTVFELLETIRDKFPRVNKIHGNQYSWLKNMQYITNEFAENFRLYLMFEEKKFFPLARRIDQNKKQVLDGTIRKLKRSVTIIEKDQQRLRNRMGAIRERGNDFDNPEGACSTFRILNHQLRQLDTNIKKQFAVESEQILPLVQQKIDAL